MARMNTVDLGVVADARDDADLWGVGFIRIFPGGVMERLNPSDVSVRSEEGHVCGLNVTMDGTCFHCGKRVSPKETDQ